MRRKLDDIKSTSRNEGNTVKKTAISYIKRPGARRGHPPNQRAPKSPTKIQSGGRIDMSEAQTRRKKELETNFLSQ